jgi:hypothetical protein
MEHAAAAEVSAGALVARSAVAGAIVEGSPAAVVKSKAEKNVTRKANKKRKKAEGQNWPEEDEEGGCWTGLKCDEWKADPIPTQVVIKSVATLKESGNEAFKKQEYEDAMELYGAAERLLQDNCTVGSLADAETRELAIALQLNMALVLQRVAEEASRVGDDAAVAEWGGHILGFLDYVLTLDPGNGKAQRRRLQATALCRRSAERVSGSVPAR